MSQQTQEVHAAYMRLWRKTNPDRITRYRLNYTSRGEKFFTDLNTIMQKFLCDKWPHQGPEII